MSKNEQVPSSVSVLATPTISPLPSPSPDEATQEFPTYVQNGLIKNSIGVISLNNNRESNGSKDIVRLYNRDGSLWYEFSYYDTHPLKFNGSNKDFAPFSFSIDYFIIALKCVREDADRYEVIVNENNGLSKFVKKKDSLLRFQTWEEHIIGLFSVGNKDSNPVLQEPKLHAKRISVSKDTFLHPNKINGDWLRVKLEDSESDSKVKQKDRFGWIRWKEKGELIIQIFYIS